LKQHMAIRKTATHGVMEGGGSYNRHARIPAGGAELALPFLEQAVRAVTIESGNEPVVIADYGSSQGKNSLAPLRAAIQQLRARIGSERPILVVHVDQAANDFNTLFDVLHRDPERYSLNDPKIYPSAIGRSFYESVLPTEHVHLGWSSYAAVWLSHIPMSIPGHFMALASTGEVLAAFERQAARDWKSFLSLRAGELRSGGRLVVVLPGRDDDGRSGLDPIFQHANEALSEMVTEGAITAQERGRMVLGTYPRRRCELLEPFADGPFNGLRVEHYDLAALPDAAWVDYERDGNREVLVNRHAGFFRAIFVPSLASAVSDGNQTFADELESRLKRRLRERPTPLHSFVQTIVLAKQET
jgi:SAM dependent carboxyl methyltransferase